MTLYNTCICAVMYTECKVKHVDIPKMKIWESVQLQMPFWYKILHTHELLLKG